MDSTFDSFFAEDNLAELWQRLQEYAGHAGREATRVVLELFFVMKSPETSIVDKGLIVAALGYQFLPEDLIPRDKYGLLSMLDNGITIAFAYSRIKADVTPAIHAQVEAILNSWFGPSEAVNHIGGTVIPAEAEVKYPNEQNKGRDTTSLPNGTNSPFYPEDDEDVIVD